MRYQANPNEQGDWRMTMLQGKRYMRSWIAALCIAAGVVTLVIGARIALACCTGCCGDCCYDSGTCGKCKGGDGITPCEDCHLCCNSAPTITKKADCYEGQCGNSTHPGPCH